MFNADRAYIHTANLAFPRRTGSEGEDQAARYIKDAFRALGLAVEEQPFRFSYLPLTIASRLMLLMVGGLVFLAAWGGGHAPKLSLLALGAVGVLTLLGSRWSAFTERLYDLPGQWTSRNIIARLPCPGATANLIFLAHYDSKSQLQPLALRLSLFLVSLLGIGTFAVYLGIAAWGPPEWTSPRLTWSLSGVILSALALLQANYSHNVSPGALDNACGVGILLELARCLGEEETKSDGRNAPDGSGFHLFFVATGAEEEGLAGAMRFMQTYGNQFDPAQSWFVNLDGPGAEGQVTVLCRYGLPPLHTGPGLTPRLLAIAAQQRIPAQTGYLPLGAGTDQMPIAWRGFETVTLQSFSWGPAWANVHSPGDTLEHISQEALQHVGTLCFELVRQGGNHCDLKATLSDPDKR